MYPDGYIGTTTHDLHQEVYQGNFYSKKISNGLVVFAHVSEGCSPNDKYATYYVILCIFGVAVLWSEKLNHPLQHIQYTPRSAISTWPPKWSHGPDITYKTFNLNSLMLQLPSTSTFNLKSILLKQTNS